MYSVTMKFSYFLPLVFVILNGNVFDVTAHETVYDISTGNNYVYHYVINDGIDVRGHTSIAFSVMACNDANIALSKYNGVDSRYTYEIVIGGWSNSQSMIRDCKQCGYMDTNKDHPLSCTEYKSFWISWANDMIKVGKGNVVGMETFLTWNNRNSHPVHYVAFATSRGSTGKWKVMRDQGIVDDLLNVILKLKKGTAYTHPTKIPAFSAFLSKGFTPSMKEIIKFDSIKTNIGGHYSPNTGVFTVPRPGLYMLSATVMSNGGKHLHCALFVNDVMSGSLFGTNYSTGTLNTLLQLKKGDRVYIKKDSKDSKPSESMYGRHWSMFSGYLIA